MTAEAGKETEAPIGADADGRIDLDEALKGLGPAERLCVTLC